jgi:hypothetical protein
MHGRHITMRRNEKRRRTLVPQQSAHKMNKDGQCALLNKDGCVARINKERQCAKAKQFRKRPKLNKSGSVQSSVPKLNKDRQCAKAEQGQAFCQSCVRQAGSVSKLNNSGRVPKL